jgi:hypothetical protein
MAKKLSQPKQYYYARQLEADPVFQTGKRLAGLGGLAAGEG